MYNTVSIRWILVDDALSGEGGKGSALEMRLARVSIVRRYPVRISQIRAERDARAIAPRLLAISAEWLKA